MAVATERNSIVTSRPHNIQNLGGTLIPNSPNGGYRLKEKLGSGSFGVVYAAEMVSPNSFRQPPCAVKVEYRKTKHPQLAYEARLLSTFQTCPGVARNLFTASDQKFRYLGMTRLGPSLEELFRNASYQFSLNQICAIAVQMIELIETIHKRGYIHRDVKPDNFLSGYEEGYEDQGTQSKSNCLHIIDFGLSKRYIDPRSESHITHATGVSLTGTARYASINAHRGHEQSRRDDMESIAHVLLYFLKRGFLPWQGVKAETKEDKYDMISQRKQKISIRSLCKGHPPQMAEYLSYCRNLEFTEVPNYTRCKALFQAVLRNMGDPQYMLSWHSVGDSTATTKASDRLVNFESGRYEKVCGDIIEQKVPPKLNKHQVRRCFTFYRSSNTRNPKNTVSVCGE